MDESGHDHKTMPYEVRGGVSIASIKVFKFLCDLQKSEEKIFGCKLSEFKTEIKGSKLLGKERFKWASQADDLDDISRQAGVRRFLTAALEKRTPTRNDFTAYGQASLKMATAIISLLYKYEAKIFACVIPKDVQKSKAFNHEDYLRKDHVCLMERFADFLKKRHEDGLMIMDQCEKSYDKKFKRQLSNYFLRTPSGKAQANWILPEPFFIESDVNYLIQVADLCIYIINTAFRKARGMNAKTRKEIQELFEEKIEKLQYSYTKEHMEKGKLRKIKVHSIKYCKNPY